MFGPRGDDRPGPVSTELPLLVSQRVNQDPGVSVPPLPHRLYRQPNFPLSWRADGVPDANCANEEGPPQRDRDPPPSASSCRNGALRPGPPYPSRQVKVANAMARLSLTPIFALWFGHGIWSKVALAVTLVFSIMFFIVFFTTTQGVKEVSPVGLANTTKMLAPTHTNCCVPWICPRRRQGFFEPAYVGGTGIRRCHGRSIPRGGARCPLPDPPKKASISIPSSPASWCDRVRVGARYAGRTD